MYTADKGVRFRYHTAPFLGWTGCACDCGLCLCGVPCVWVVVWGLVRIHSAQASLQGEFRSEGFNLPA